MIQKGDKLSAYLAINYQEHQAKTKEMTHQRIHIRNYLGSLCGFAN